MKKQIISSIIFFILFSNQSFAVQKQDFVAALKAFDKAQSNLNLKKSISFLSKNVSVEIITCDKSTERMRLNDIKKTFNTVFTKAELLDIKRDIIDIQKVKNENSYLIKSNITERLVGYNGKYDHTTVSKDLTKISLQSDEFKINWMKATIVNCN